MDIFPDILFLFAAGSAEEFHFIQDLAIILGAATMGGWLCRKIGLSVVVGYLVAGILIGPANVTKWFDLHLVDDVKTIQSISHVGLVFIMFWIGLHFSLKRVRKLGLSFMLATPLAAMLIFTIIRMASIPLEQPEAWAAFIAATMMFCSSAIVSKVVNECGLQHEKPGQRAAGLFLTEDGLVVLVLTILSSYAQFGHSGEAPADGDGVSQGIITTVALLLTFTALLIFLGAGLIPSFMNALRKHADNELTVLIVVSLLFGFALVSVYAGYSMALGAFLIGAILSDTRAKDLIERQLSGMHLILVTIFFTTIGMMIDVETLWTVAPYILLLAMVTTILRFLCYGSAMLIVGLPSRESIQTALLITPIGEFSFVIATLGVTSGIMPKEFYPLVVGTALVTAITGPLLTRYSEPITLSILKYKPRILHEILDLYQHWLRRLQSASGHNILWKLSQRRVFQVAREFVMISGILIFSQPIISLAITKLGPDLLVVDGTRYIIATMLIGLTAPPIVSLWRNIGALSLLYAEAGTRNVKAREFAKPVLENIIRFGASALFLVWFISLLPLGWHTFGILAGGGLILMTFIALYWRRMVYWHSKFELALDSAFDDTNVSTQHKLPTMLEEQEGWALNLAHCEIPSETTLAGQTLADLQIRSRFGVSIVGIERHGHFVVNPGPTHRFYPHDRLLILGTKDKVGEIQTFFESTYTDTEAADHTLDEIVVETVRVPENWTESRPLLELNLQNDYGVQLAGIRRNGEQILFPGANEHIEAHDELLVLADPLHLQHFHDWLKGMTTSAPEEEHGMVEELA